jgi:uncharacterized protein YjbI with pentapeptide repeats
VQLGGAHLVGAGLHNAHLEGAWLGGAHLERADVRGARLERADVTGAHLEGSRASAATAWPAGFRWRDANVSRVDLPGEPTGADHEATAATTAAVGGAELGRAPVEREDRPHDTAWSGSDEDGQPRSPSHHE